MRGVGAILGAAASLTLSLAMALVGAAAAQYPGGGGDGSTGGGGDASVAAEGNPFTGGLAFDPAEVSVSVGDVVTWTNTDFLVPHTATEDHGLWSLTGTYGGTPASPPGFGPGESRGRAFEAGTFNYFCEVHPDDMRGVVRVPAKVKRVRKGRKPRLRVIWAPAPPADGQVFDVERRRRGKWKTARDGTTAARAKFRGKRGAFRARLRLAADPSAASDWSPPAKP